MSADRKLLTEVTKELWFTVKKLRPEIDKDTRLQLVLKALITIGDLPDHVEAAMVVGICSEMEAFEGSENNQSENTEEPNSINSSSGRKVVRRSSAK